MPVGHSPCEELSFGTKIIKFDPKFIDFTPDKLFLKILYRKQVFSNINCYNTRTKANKIKQKIPFFYIPNKD